jgi:uncharacterized protein (TIGR03437 family)
MPMSKAILTCCATLALAVGSFDLQAQTQNQVVYAGFTEGFWFYPQIFPTVAAGQLITLFTNAIDVPDAVATEIPLPKTLSGVSVLARVVGAADTRGYPTSLPILSIYRQKLSQMPDGVYCSTVPDSIFCSNTQITVEIPTEGVCHESPVYVPRPNYCDTAAPSVTLPFTPPLLVLNVKANGVTGPDMPILVAEYNNSPPHLLNSCDSIFGVGPIFGGPADCHGLINHPDGELVTSANPAKVGEVLSLFATGLLASGGLNIDDAPTGYPVKIPVPAFPEGLVLSYTFETVSSGSIQISTSRRIQFREDWAGYIPGFFGLAQVNFTVPPIPDKLGPCSPSGYNVSLSLRNQTAGTVNMCIQQ